jgi:hypothetical protein
MYYIPDIFNVPRSERLDPGDGARPIGRLFSAFARLLNRARAEDGHEDHAARSRIDPG